MHSYNSNSYTLSALWNPVRWKIVWEDFPTEFQPFSFFCSFWLCKLSRRGCAPFPEDFFKTSSDSHFEYFCLVLGRKESFLLLKDVTLMTHVPLQNFQRSKALENWKQKLRNIFSHKCKIKILFKENLIRLDSIFCSFGKRPNLFRRFRYYIFLLYQLSV